MIEHLPWLTRRPPWACWLLFRKKISPQVGAAWVKVKVRVGSSDQCLIAKWCLEINFERMIHAEWNYEFIGKEIWDYFMTHKLWPIVIIVIKIHIPSIYKFFLINDYFFKLMFLACSVIGPDRSELRLDCLSAISIILKSLYAYQ